MTIKELRQMAKQKGIKYYSRMNSTTLCELLGLPLIKNPKFEKFNKNKIKNPVIIVLTNKETGETQEFKSIYKVAKSVNKNPGSILYHIKINKEIKIGEKTFLVNKKLSSMYDFQRNTSLKIGSFFLNLILKK